MEPVTHRAAHHIVTSGPPVIARPCRLTEDKLTLTKIELDTLFAGDIVRPSCGP